MTSYPDGVGIAFTDLYLSALHNTADGCWRADLHVQHPPHRMPRTQEPDMRQYKCFSP
jgi:hypothetical protein